MTRTIISIRVDAHVWEAVQAMYPRKVSRMIEDYLRALLDTGDVKDVKVVELEKQLRVQEKEYDSLGSQIANTKVILAKMKEKRIEQLGSDKKRLKEEMDEALAKSDALINSGWTERL